MTIRRTRRLDRSVAALERATLLLLAVLVAWARDPLLRATTASRRRRHAQALYACDYEFHQQNIPHENECKCCRLGQSQSIRRPRQSISRQRLK